MGISLCFDNRDLCLLKWNLKVISVFKHAVKLFKVHIFVGGIAYLYTPRWRDRKHTKIVCKRQPFVIRKQIYKQRTKQTTNHEFVELFVCLNKVLIIPFSFTSRCKWRNTVYTTGADPGFFSAGGTNKWSQQYWARNGQTVYWWIASEVRFKFWS